VCPWDGRNCSRRGASVDSAEVEARNGFELGALMGAYFFEWLPRCRSYAKFGAPLGTNSSFGESHKVSETQITPHNCGFFLCLRVSGAIKGAWTFGHDFGHDSQTLAGHGLHVPKLATPLTGLQISKARPKPKAYPLADGNGLALRA